MTLVIRPARPEDRLELATMLGEVHDYFDALAGEAQEGRPSPEALWAAASLSFDAEPVCSTLIAQWDGRIAGYLAYHFGIWEVYAALCVAGLFVRDELRGKGIGRALMEEARAIATKRGVTHIAWMVWRRNDPALAFYRNLGARTYDDDIQMVMPVAR